MQKRSSKKDINIIASNIVSGATEPQETAKNINAVILGRLGGQKGGKARAKKLTPEQRSEIARKAAQARWKQER